MKTFITITLRVEGFHHWPQCPIAEVAFLRHRHRHLFHIRCVLLVDHPDRDVEIILFKRHIEKWLEQTYGRPCEFGSMSCEMIAAKLMETFALVSCCVEEDGENGALVIA